MIVILPHYILFNFWCMTNTTHMIISLWGLSLFLSSIESSWLCIIVIAFVQMCANSMLNICSLFQELKISWLYLHEKKNAFTNHSYHMCSVEFVYATMPDLFSIPAYFNDVIFFFSVKFFFTILKWNALDFSTYAQLKWLIRSGQNCALHRHTC